MHPSESRVHVEQAALDEEAEAEGEARAEAEAEAREEAKAKEEAKEVAKAKEEAEAREEAAVAKEEAEAKAAAKRHEERAEGRAALDEAKAAESVVEVVEDEDGRRLDNVREAEDDLDGGRAADDGDDGDTDSGACEGSIGEATRPVLSANAEDLMLLHVPSLELSSQPSSKLSSARPPPPVVASLFVRSSNMDLCKLSMQVVGGRVVASVTAQAHEERETKVQVSAPVRRRHASLRPEPSAHLSRAEHVLSVAAWWCFLRQPTLPRASYHRALVPSAAAPVLPTGQPPCVLPSRPLRIAPQVLVRVSTARLFAAADRFYHQARAHASSGAIALALEACAAGLRLQPYHEGLRHQRSYIDATVDGVCRRAERCAAEKRYGEALATCEMWLKQLPAHLKLLQLKADTLLLLGEDRAAISAYRSALRIAPTSQPLQNGQLLSSFVSLRPAHGCKYAPRRRLCSLASAANLLSRTTSARTRRRRHGCSTPTLIWQGCSLRCNGWMRVEMKLRMRTLTKSTTSPTRATPSRTGGARAAPLPAPRATWRRAATHRSHASHLTLLPHRLSPPFCACPGPLVPMASPQADTSSWIAAAQEAVAVHRGDPLETYAPGIPQPQHAQRAPERKRQLPCLRSETFPSATDAEQECGLSQLRLPRALRSDGAAA